MITLPTMVEMPRIPMLSFAVDDILTGRVADQSCIYPAKNPSHPNINNQIAHVAIDVRKSLHCSSHDCCGFDMMAAAVSCTRNEFKSNLSDLWKIRSDITTIMMPTAMRTKPEYLMVTIYCVTSPRGNV